MKAGQPVKETFDIVEGPGSLSRSTSLLESCSKPLRHQLEPGSPVDIGAPVNIGPADWAMAVRAAAARLGEHFGSPDHPAVAALATDLAALLCAYGLVEEEIQRMRVRHDAAVSGEPCSDSSKALSGRYRHGHRTGEAYEIRQSDVLSTTW